MQDPAAQRNDNSTNSAIDSMAKFNSIELIASGLNNVEKLINLQHFFKQAEEDLLDKHSLKGHLFIMMLTSHIKNIINKPNLPSRIDKNNYQKITNRFKNSNKIFARDLNNFIKGLQKVSMNITFDNAIERRIIEINSILRAHKALLKQCGINLSEYVNDSEYMNEMFDERERKAISEVDQLLGWVPLAISKSILDHLKGESANNTLFGIMIRKLLKNDQYRIDSSSLMSTLEGYDGGVAICLTEIGKNHLIREDVKKEFNVERGKFFSCSIEDWLPNSVIKYLIHGRNFFILMIFASILVICMATAVSSLNDSVAAYYIDKMFIALLVSLISFCCTQAVLSREGLFYDKIYKHVKKRSEEPCANYRGEFIEKFGLCLEKDLTTEVLIVNMIFRLEAEKSIYDLLLENKVK